MIVAFTVVMEVRSVHPFNVSQKVPRVDINRAISTILMENEGVVSTLTLERPLPVWQYVRIRLRFMATFAEAF